MNLKKFFKTIAASVSAAILVACGKVDKTESLPTTSTQPTEETETTKRETAKNNETTKATKETEVKTTEEPTIIFNDEDIEVEVKKYTMTELLDKYKSEGAIKELSSDEINELYHVQENLEDVENYINQLTPEIKQNIWQSILAILTSKISEELNTNYGDFEISSENLAVIDGTIYVVNGTEKRELPLGLKDGNAIFNMDSLSENYLKMQEDLNDYILVNENNEEHSNILEKLEEIKPFLNKNNSLYDRIKSFNSDDNNTIYNFERAAEKYTKGNPDGFSNLMMTTLENTIPILKEAIQENINTSLNPIVTKSLKNNEQYKKAIENNQNNEVATVVSVGEDGDLEVCVKDNETVLSTLHITSIDCSSINVLLNTLNGLETEISGIYNLPETDREINKKNIFEELLKLYPSIIDTVEGIKIEDNKIVIDPQEEEQKEEKIALQDGTNVYIPKINDEGVERA